MIFTADLVEKILAGEKTQTRRPRSGSNPTGERGGWLDEPCRYKPGRTYAVQPGRGKKAVARIHVLSVKPEALCDMTDEDVRAEGFAARDAFVAKWLSIYGHGNWLDPVWRIEFELSRAENGHPKGET